MNCEHFSSDIVFFMESVGVVDLLGSGLNWPPCRWDWLDCCRVCVWLAFSGYKLPDGLENRMILGPSNPVSRLYFEWHSRRDEVEIPFDFWELAG